MRSIFLISLVLLSTLLVNGEANDIKFQIDTKAVGLIVNGKDAPRDKYPSQILLFQETIQGYGKFVCGGTILDRDHVLTAAHCISDGTFVVAVGKHKMSKNNPFTQYSYVSSIIIHQNYDYDTNLNDIAILKLQTSLEYNELVQSVQLAAVGEKPFGKRCFASGFGAVNDRTGAIADTLQEVRTRVIGTKKCKRFARNYNAADLINQSVVCTKDKRKGVCSGDSGGPLGCFDDETGTYVQYGVLSWGSSKCVQGFNVYTRVSEYLDWISANMSN